LEEVLAATPESIIVTGFLDVVLLVDSVMVSPPWRLAVTMASGSLIGQRFGWGAVTILW
jgi:hypothetical protein